MRRIIPIILLSIFALTMAAEPVTKQQALTKASKFFAAHGLAFDKKAPVMMAPGRGNAPASTSPYYVFNAKGNKGFAIVSGDDRTTEVLGYSTTNSFDMENIPDNVRDWLDEYARQIEYIQTHNLSSSVTNTTTTDRAVIKPLITTQWNQTYNGLCPMVNNVKAYTGCVPTAMAQILYYNYQKYPDKMPTALKTDIPGYEYDAYWPDPIHVKVDGCRASSSSINWNNIRDYDSGYEISNLMWYCGISVQAEYASSRDGSTSAYCGDIPSSFMLYFGMDPTIRYVNRNSYSTNAWEDLIYSELQNDRPVLYGGFTESSGHAFIIDGYAGDDYYHVNWGWGGYCDGSFILSVLEPHGSGIGGAGVGAGYNYGQEAVINIKPDEGGVPNFPITTRELTAYNTNENCYLSYGAINGGPGEDSYTFSYGILGSDGSITQVGDVNTKYLRSGGYYYNYLYIKNNKAFAKPGEYKVVPIGKREGETNWHLLTSPDKYVSVIVETGKPIQIIFYPQYKLSVGGLSVAEEPRAVGLPVSLTFNAKNEGDDKFSGELYLYVGKSSDKPEFKYSQGFSVNANSSKQITSNWKPTETGTYNIWLCLDKEGLNPIDSVKNIEIGPGNVKGNLFTLNYINIPSKYTTSDNWEVIDGRLYKTLVGEEVNFEELNFTANESGNYQLRIDLDYLDGNTRRRYGYWNWDSHTFEKGQTFSMGGTNVGSLRTGKYIFKLYVLNSERTDTLWCDDTYGFIVKDYTNISSTDLTDNGGDMYISSNLHPTGSNEDLSKLFDNNKDTKLCARYEDMPVWVIYKSPKPLLLTSYALTSANDYNSRDPKEWTLEGSNDSITWTTIDTQSDQSFARRYMTNSYDVAPTAAYKYIRLNVTALRSDYSDIFQLAEFQLFGSEVDPTGITGVVVNDTTEVKVYNLQGQKMGTVSGAEIDAFLKTLPRGIYIINGRKVAN